MHKHTPKHRIVLAILGFMFISSCSYFEQNDFIVIKTISTEPNEHIFYTVYQTGLDNYTFEFAAAQGTDTTKLFHYFLNDAVYTAMRFTVEKNAGTLKIITNMPTENMSAITKNKTIVYLSNK
jgi:hypothetical protein